MEPEFAHPAVPKATSVWTKVGPSDVGQEAESRPPSSPKKLVHDAASLENLYQVNPDSIQEGIGSPANSTTPRAYSQQSTVGSPPKKHSETMQTQWLMTLMLSLTLQNLNQFQPRL